MHGGLRFTRCIMKTTNMSQKREVGSERLSLCVCHLASGPLAVAYMRFLMQSSRAK